MIGKLTGIVDSIGDDAVILDVNGVGYLVHCPTSSLSRLTVGGTASLIIEMKVSEDAIKLYGFVSKEEREWFRLLQTVQNVGSKLALSVLSTFTIAELKQALSLGDKAMIGRAPGVGPKLALRIATELKDKASRLMQSGEVRALGVSPISQGPISDAVSALMHLGYSDGRAAEAVARAAKLLGDDSQASALIREALKGMAR